MRILHTADWHLGKRLHKEELHEDHEMFLQWLEETVNEQSIDCLLISGDVFDHSNPSSKARKQYFNAISRLSEHCQHIVITGGNHDSPNELNASREILRTRGVHVVGGMPETLEDLLIPLSQDGEVKLVVAAIPYLRNPELRKFVTSESYEDRQRRANEGIHAIYQEAADLCEKQYPGIPSMAMGHLTVIGSKLPAHKKDVEIGSLAAISQDCFPEYFDYYALGHVHRPQRVGGDENMRYSGSPIHISFSERDDNKEVVIIDIQDGKTLTNSIQVPLCRHLKKISGSFEEVASACRSFTPSSSGLQDFIELEVILPNPSMTVNTDLATLVDGFPEEKGKILKYRITIENAAHDMARLYKQNVHVEDLSPLDVFDNKLQDDNIDPEEGKLMREAFVEILEHFQGR